MLRFLFFDLFFLVFDALWPSRSIEHRRELPKGTLVGEDGLVFQGDFYSWALVSQVTRRLAEVSLLMTYGKTLEVPRNPTTIAREIEEAYQKYQSQPEPPVLPFFEPPSVREDYRSSNRSLLAEVADNPRSPPDARIRAAQALVAAEGLPERVEQSLQRAVNPDVVRFVANL